jgi:hypothetical protein
MKKAVLLFVSGCFAVAASCSTTHPKLQFFKLDSNYSIGDTEDKFTFRMPNPVIVITSQQNERETPSLKPVFTPTVKSREGMYAIRSADPWFVDTKYTIGYQQNSFLLKSFGIELTDNRVKYVQELGAIVSVVIPLAVAAAPPPGATPRKEANLAQLLPYNVDVADCFGDKLDVQNADETVSCSMILRDKDGHDSSWKVTIITDRNNQNSTVSYDDFFTNRGKVSANFPVPDCKEGFVYLEDGKQRFGSPITFANPTRLTTVPIPGKGSITYHPICSADTAYAPPDVAKPLDLLKTTIDQVAAARKAYEDAKKSEQ